MQPLPVQMNTTAITKRLASGLVLSTSLKEKLDLNMGGWKRELKGL